MAECVYQFKVDALLRDYNNSPAVDKLRISAYRSIMVKIDFVEEQS